jgi:hypothetical protein
LPTPACGNRLPPTTRGATYPPAAPAFVGCIRLVFQERSASAARPVHCAPLLHCISGTSLVWLPLNLFAHTIVVAAAAQAHGCWVHAHRPAAGSCTSTVENERHVRIAMRNIGRRMKRVGQRASTVEQPGHSAQTRACAATHTAHSDCHGWHERQRTLACDSPRPIRPAQTTSTLMHRAVQRQQRVSNRSPVDLLQQR